METLRKMCNLLNENKKYVLINTAQNATDALKELGKERKESKEA